MPARTKTKNDAHHQAHVPDDPQSLVGDRTPLLFSTLEKVVRKVQDRESPKLPETDSPFFALLSGLAFASKLSRCFRFPRGEFEAYKKWRSSRISNAP